MTFVIVGIFVLFLSWALISSAQDRQQARVDAAAHASGAGTGAGPQPLCFVVTAASPFAESVHALRELLAEPTTAPVFTPRSRPVVIVDDHVITLSVDDKAFLLIPTHEIRALDVVQVAVTARGRAPRMMWGITLKVGRGERVESIDLVPLSLLGGRPNVTFPNELARDMYARLWPKQLAADEARRQAVAIQSARVPTGLPVPPSLPRGLGAWSPVLAIGSLIPIAYIVPIAVGNTRAIGWVVNGKEITAAPAVMWWLLILAILVGAGLLMRGFVRRLRWARAQGHGAPAPLPPEGEDDARDERADDEVRRVDEGVEQGPREVRVDGDRDGLGDEVADAHEQAEDDAVAERRHL